MSRAWLIVVSCAAGAGCSAPSEPQTSGAVVFEGARLITGDGGAPIERSAFVVEDGRFARVGHQDQVAVPAGASRVDLTGKTVMPAMVDLHGHLGFQDVPAGTMSKETYTRDNLIDHLERLAYHGISAVIGVGDLVDRSDLLGGRTRWGDVPFRVRSETIPGAALFRTSGPGIAWPGSGAQGHPSRSDVPYPVTSLEEARAAVDDYAAMKPEFIKIWVDDRGGRTKKLTPAMYRAIVEEAHTRNIPVVVHGASLADAKELVRAGVQGWAHTPVRREAVDEELLAIVRQQAAGKLRTKMWMTPVLRTAWLTSQGGRRPAWLDDPLLRETYPLQQNEELAMEMAAVTPDQAATARRTFENDARNTMLLRAAGIRVVLGTDTGQLRHRIGYFAHLELESLVAIGMSPADVLVAATRDSADVAGMNAGMAAAGRSADFIVLDANPLDNISNTRKIADVYLRGRQVDRAGLRARWQAQFDRNDSSGGSPGVTPGQARTASP